MTDNLLKEQRKFEQKYFQREYFHEPTLYNLNKSEVKILKHKIKEIKKISRSNNYKITFLPEIYNRLEDWYLNPDSLITKAKCDTNRLRIKLDGELVHCEIFSYGNLANDDFGKIIESAQAQKLKKTIATHNMPFCSRCCLRFGGYLDI